MMQRLGLRDRLALAFAAALTLAYILFALLAVAVVHGIARTEIDARLATVAHAAQAIIDHPQARTIDATDREQFAQAASGTGYVFVRADGTHAFASRADTPPWVGATLVKSAGTTLTVEYPRDGVRVLAMPLRANDPTSATLVVWQSLTLFAELEHNLTLVLAAAGLLVAGIGYLVGAQIARRGLLPLAGIAKVVADIESHDLSLRVGAQMANDEIGRLAATFDRMLDRLQAAFERQRQFTADASHELRAPLATLRAEADLALLRERGPEEYRASLQAIAGDADRLDELIDALLAAARGDAGEIDQHVVDLTRITQQAVARINAFARARDVVINAAYAPEALITGDAALLERALLGVLHNAVKYTPAGASTHVAVQSSATEVTVTIRDEGPGFTREALDSALERFWRDDVARGRSGSGLGLAIATSIVQRFGGTIRLANAPGVGAVVEICFRIL
jgi:signal transduction histidine kinase